MDREGLVEKAGKAICQERCAYMGEPPCWSLDTDDGGPYPWPAEACEPDCLSLARAALTPSEDARSAFRAAFSVVIQRIRAAERERCARVADGTSYHGRYRTWPWWANPDGSQGNREVESDVVRHADSIAAAIRSLTEE